MARPAERAVFFSATCLLPGFGSIHETPKKAKGKNQSITRVDVEKYEKATQQADQRLQGFELLHRVPFARFEYQIDMMFVKPLTKVPGSGGKIPMKNSEPAYIRLVVIDIFQQVGDVRSNQCKCAKP